METDPRMKVVIAGGGVGGLEAAMALRALAGTRVDIALLAPEPEFVYRPLAVGEPFGLGAARRYPLEPIAEELGLELVPEALVSVDADGRRAVTSTDRVIRFDALVIALGALRRPAWDHVLTFRGSDDSLGAAELVVEVEAGEVESVAFVVPRGVTWPLPLYELALMTAGRAREVGASVELVLFTPESSPLAVFGREASAEVARVLEAAGVAVARGVTVDVTATNELVIPSEDSPLRFERVLAVPLLAGPALDGVPCDRRGFVEVDDHCRVRGLDGVYAVGDATDYPVKQGGVAAQQADAAAAQIAEGAGVEVEAGAAHPELRARLMAGELTRFLSAGPREDRDRYSAAADRPLWWPGHKIAAPHLAPYLAELDARPAS